LGTVKQKTSGETVEEETINKRPHDTPLIGGSSGREEKPDLRAELKLAEARAEALYSELQALAYTVSHDLRAPLRAIEGFSRILLDDFCKALPEEAQGFLQHIITNTQVLSSQIEDLLMFYRLGKTPPSKILTHPDTVAREAWDELRLKGVDRGIAPEIAKMGEVRADPGLLRQVFVQLFSNALKATAKTKQPRIAVGSDPGEHETAIWVSDNGVGFDPQYDAKLFQVFQKLHPQSEFTGNGIGLAIVRRIILAHNGRAWAEGATGKGAKFFFSLPS
jgi:light-regulated signal transduction histidine kinase (bacteriophytochrome)